MNSHKKLFVTKFRKLSFDDFSKISYSFAFWNDLFQCKNVFLQLSPYEKFSSSFVRFSDRE